MNEEINYLETIIDIKKEEIIDEEEEKTTETPKVAGISKIHLYKIVTAKNGKYTSFGCNVKGCNAVTNTKSLLVDHVRKIHRGTYYGWFKSYGTHHVCENCDFYSTEFFEADDHRSICTKTPSQDVQYKCIKCKTRFFDYEKCLTHVTEKQCRIPRKYTSNFKYRKLNKNSISSENLDEMEAAIQRSKDSRDNSSCSIDGIQEISLFVLVKSVDDEKMKFKCNVRKCDIIPVINTKARFFEHIKSYHRKHYQHWFGSLDHHFVCENCDFNSTDLTKVNIHYLSCNKPVAQDLQYRCKKCNYQNQDFDTVACHVKENQCPPIPMEDPDASNPYFVKRKIFKKSLASRNTINEIDAAIQRSKAARLSSHSSQVNVENNKLPPVIIIKKHQPIEESQKEEPLEDPLAL